MSKLYRAHSLLYRRQILQENIRWKALDEIYKIYILLHRCNLKIFYLFSFFQTIGLKNQGKVRYRTFQLRSAGVFGPETTGRRRSSPSRRSPRPARSRAASARRTRAWSAGAARTPRRRRAGPSRGSRPARTTAAPCAGPARPGRWFAGAT